MVFALTIIMSYLVGSIPSAIWVGRLVRGIDIREHGSGNMGAANTARVLGFRWAVVVAVIDILKGFAPVFWLGGIGGAAGVLAVDDVRLVLGAVAIIGHLFPVFAGFRGGKGVLTATGVFLAILPVEIGLALLVWLLVFGLTRIVSVGSLLATMALLAAVLIRRFVMDVPIADSTITATAILVALVFYTHRANLKRLLRGEESGFKRRRT